MTAFRTDDITKEERSGTAALWFGVFAGPAAWSLQILVGYNLEEIACRPGSASTLIMGAGIEPIIVVMTVVLMVVTLAAGAVALSCGRRIRKGASATTETQRARWMAWAGVVVSSVFAFMLLLGLFPVLFLDVCETPL